MERLFKKVFPVLTQGRQYQMHKICYGSYCLDIRKQLNFFRKNWILLSSGFLNLCHRTLLIFSRSICSYICKAITNNTVLKEIISSTPRLALNSWPSTFSLLNAEVVDMLHAWIAYFLALSVHITLRSGSSCCLTVFQIALNWTEKWDGFANPSGTSQHTQRSEPDTLGEVLCACQAEERACWIFVQDRISATSEPRLIMTKIWTPEVNKCGKGAGQMMVSLLFSGLTDSTVCTDPQTWTSYSENSYV